MLNRLQLLNLLNPFDHLNQLNPLNCGLNYPVVDYGIYVDFLHWRRLVD
jgi:hypothetical protein